MVRFFFINDIGLIGGSLRTNLPPSRTPAGRRKTGFVSSSWLVGIDVERWRYHDARFERLGNFLTLETKIDGLPKIDFKVFGFVKRFNL